MKVLSLFLLFFRVFIIFWVCILLTSLSKWNERWENIFLYSFIRFSNLKVEVCLSRTENWKKRKRKIAKRKTFLLAWNFFTENKERWNEEKFSLRKRRNFPEKKEEKLGKHFNICAQKKKVVIILFIRNKRKNRIYGEKNIRQTKKSLSG